MLFIGGYLLATLAASAQHKISRFIWNSRTFFVIEDGSTINRALYYSVDRKLTVDVGEMNDVRRFLQGEFQRF